MESKAMIPEKSSNYDLPNSYENIEQTLITADQILSDAAKCKKPFSFTDSFIY